MILFVRAAVHPTQGKWWLGRRGFSGGLPGPFITSWRVPVVRYIAGIRSGKKMSGDAEHNIGELTADQCFVLRILGHGAMDVEALVTATFSTKQRMQSIIEELRGRGLVEKRVEGKRVLFKRKDRYDEG